MAERLQDLTTPCLILDRQRLARNIARMNDRIARLGVALRPHVKTCKSIEVSRLAAAGHSGAIAVSTLAEAQFFALAGFTDILYAVGIVPSKLPDVAALNAGGDSIKVVLDDPRTARELARWGVRNGVQIPALIEIDSDGRRAGLDPDDPAVIEAASTLADSPGTRFLGVMTHAGASYDCRTTDAIRDMAAQEARAVVAAAENLASAGLPCTIVSVGSTPTALFADALDGITEVRAGVYMFFDLFQVGLGVCGIDDIAVSVLATVIGHNPRLNRLIVDAGALALSQDRATAGQITDQGYGLVCDAQTVAPIHGMTVQSVNQEHGLVTMASGKLDFDRFSIGSQLRILPNHACMTAASHQAYHVVEAPGGPATEEWPRCGGW